MLNTSRIDGAIDTPRMDEADVTLVGVGGSFGLASDLVRCRLRAIHLCDFDRVEASNVARQEHMPDRIGIHKVDALAEHLRRINPDLAVTCLPADFCTLRDEQIDHYFGHTDLFIFATDSFRAQARGNEVALRLKKPAVWIGLYAGGVAGEVIFWHQGIDACFRCLCARRYEAHGSGSGSDPSSERATVLDVHFLDAIAGMIAVGLLTRGADNRFGRLIDQLGNRNFIQVKIDPDWAFNGRDPVREQLGIVDGNDTYFAWNTVARRDPDGGQPPCPDCKRFRGRPAAAQAEALTI